MTIRDIAALAGVSKSTVSRVLNNSPNVDEKTREKVMRVVREKDFIPSAMAQGLSRQYANTIGVILPEAGGSFFGNIIQGINETLINTPYTILLCCTENKAEYEIRALDTLRQQKVSGILLTSSSGFYENDDAYKIRQTLENFNVPVVLIDRTLKSSKWDGVYSDNSTGAYVATEALLKKGFKKIGAYISDTSLSIGSSRYKGFIQALSDYHIPIMEEFIITEKYPASMQDVYWKTCELIKSGNLPEAIFLGNGIIANGFYKGILEKGIVPGKDIHCVGFDYSEFLDIINLPYSYLERNSKLLGETAANSLLKSLSNPSGLRQEYIIPSTLHLDKTLQ
ncbi:MAG: LacI family DNA-binding transcriptional regulator [Candidatus Choladocola sp.]|nr:LacI family DNA-binding transcriptional regulator [Candidatus Choladocola sp.]